MIDPPLRGASPDSDLAPPPVSGQMNLLIVIAAFAAGFVFGVLLLVGWVRDDATHRWRVGSEILGAWVLVFIEKESTRIQIAKLRAKDVEIAEKLTAARQDAHDSAEALNAHERRVRELRRDDRETR